MTRIANIFRLVISAFLASLGFSCFYGGNGGGYAEYGSPHATYKVKGVVVSEENDSPIVGIRAELREEYSYSNYVIATAYTDSQGVFFLQGSAFPRATLNVELTDVDGEINGSFVSMNIEADFSNKTFTGGSGAWYDGEAEIDLGIIRMKPE